MGLQPVVVIIRIIMKYRLRLFNQLIKRSSHYHFSRSSTSWNYIYSNNQRQCPVIPWLVDTRSTVIWWWHSLFETRFRLFWLCELTCRLHVTITWSLKPNPAWYSTLLTVLMLSSLVKRRSSISQICLYSTTL